MPEPPFYVHVMDFRGNDIGADGFSQELHRSERNPVPLAKLNGCLAKGELCDDDGRGRGAVAEACGDR